MAMTVRFSTEDDERLRSIAEREGRSKQEVLTSALRVYDAKQDEFRTKHVARFLSEDAELLDLLSR